MLLLPEHFKILRNNIQPSEDRAAAASAIPSKVRDFLQSSTKINTVEPHSRLAGSYARKTAIKDIKDVDILLLVSPDYYDQEPSVVHKDLFSALRGLPEALEDNGEVYSRRRNRRSISVHLENQNFDLDIVPVIVLNDLDNILKIPDRNLNAWVDTHPLGYARLLSALNQQQQKKVKPLIKMIKHWRDINMTILRPKSYWLECLIFHQFDTQILSGTASYAELFRDSISNMYEIFQEDFEKDVQVPTILDPVLGQSITNWERPAFERFMRCLNETIIRVNHALNEDDEVKAIEFWENIFGTEWFPNSKSVERALQLQNAALSNTIYITSSGRVETSKPLEKAVRPSIQRFYGEIDDQL